MGRRIICFLLSAFLILAAIAFTNCKKTEKQDEMFIGTASAMKNGELWNTECISYMNKINPDIICLNLLRYSNPRGYWDEIFIGNINRVTGKYEIVSALNIDPFPDYVSYCASWDGNDVIEGTYSVLKTENNYIDITKMDESTKEFAGNFSITFVRDTPYHIIPNLPDTLRFTDGVFQTRISFYPS